MRTLKDAGRPFVLTPAIGFVAGMLVLVGVLSVAMVSTGPKLPLLIVIGLACAFVLCTVNVSWTFSIAIASYVYVGHAAELGLPIDASRCLIGLGFARLAVRAWNTRSARALTEIGWWHAWWLAAASAYAVGSAAAVGTLRDSESLFALLDVYGIVPFLLFAVAPKVFSTDRERRNLVAVLLAASGYLAVTGCLEGVGLGRFTWPAYINDPSVGIHFGRARGPFVAGVPMGVALTFGIITGLLALHLWRDTRIRVLSSAIIALSLVAIVFTLTRGVWVGAVPAVLIVMAMLPRARPWIPASVLVGAASLAVVLTVVPSLHAKVTDRTEQKGPVWERENTNAAALRLIADRPVLGVGWRNYQSVGDNYLRQPTDIPMNGIGVVVHNTFLRTAADLGLIGFALWIGALLICALLPALLRGPPERDPWRAALLGMLLCIAINDLFVPSTSPYPLIVLWTIAGIVAYGEFGAGGDATTSIDQLHHPLRRLALAIG